MPVLAIVALAAAGLGVVGGHRIVQGTVSTVKAADHGVVAVAKVTAKGARAVAHQEWCGVGGCPKR